MMISEAFKSVVQVQNKIYFQHKVESEFEALSSIHTSMPKG